MRDIARRIQRYRLARYAPARRALPMIWVWIALGAWALWAGIVSDHSFYRLWQLDRMTAREQASLERMRAERQKLDRKTRDPRARMLDAERELRERDGYSRPNEIIYRIDDGGPASTKP